MSAPAAALELSELASLEPAWEELAERLQASPFLRPGWIAAWWRAFGRGQLEIAVERDRDGHIAALLPLRRDGGMLASPANWHTPEFGLLARSQAAARRLCAALLARGSRRFALGFLAPAQAELVRAEALAQGRRVIQRTLQRSPYLALEGDWESCWQRLGKGFRDDLVRSRRRLEEHGTVSCEVSSACDEALLARGFAVEASGWKGARGTAIRSQPAQLGFYSEVARWAAGRGWLRLAFLRLGERALAFDLALEHAGVHYLLKTGYDPAFAELGPGKLLRQEMLARAFREGLRSYEFLGAAEAWKLRWTSTTRARELVQAFRPSPLGLLDWSLQRHARPLAKRVRDLAQGRHGPGSP